MAIFDFIKDAGEKILHWGAPKHEPQQAQPTPDPSKPQGATVHGATKEDTGDAILKYIKAQNPVFAHSYDSYTQKSFDKLVDDMRLIVSNKSLSKDPTRSDVYWLSQYIQMRDGVQAMLKQRAQSGGDKTIGAKSNADLAKAFAAGVEYINSQSPYFKQFAYSGVIENDPLLVSTGVQ